jgi:hypothetical protein
LSDQAPYYRIISIVLSSDASDFRKSADKIERSKKGPSKGHLAAIRDFIAQPREKHEQVREFSKRHQMSVVAKIFLDADPNLLTSLSESQHDQCLEYLSALLSARDRDEITRVLCRQAPDLFTQAAREHIAALSPFIHKLHEHVDLSEQMSSLETFLVDLITTSKPVSSKSDGGLKNGFRKFTSSSNTTTTRAPSVEEYVSLLQRNRHLLYKFLHQAAKKCPELREEFRDFSNSVIKVFQQTRTHLDSLEGSDRSAPNSLDTPTTLTSENSPVGSPVPSVRTTTKTLALDKRRQSAAGMMTGNLQDLFAPLSDETRRQVLDTLDAHAAYLTALEELSMARMQKVLDNLDVAEKNDKESAGGNQSFCGPGMFLTRWQDLLDETAIGPALLRGPVRCGRDVKSSIVQGKTGHASMKGYWDPEELSKTVEKDVPRAPDVRCVVDALGDGFKGAVCEWLNSRYPDSSPPSEQGAVPDI